MPIITPPFVVGVAILLLFGRSGILTRFGANLCDVRPGRCVHPARYKTPREVELDRRRAIRLPLDLGDRDRARVSDAMQAAFLTRRSSHWEALFGAAKAPGTAQRSRSEWLAVPHAPASGLMLEVEVDDPRHGKMRQMGHLSCLATDAGAMDKPSGPVTDEFGADLPARRAEAPRAAPEGGESGGWLDRLKVVDLTNVIAGPTIGATLARFGAQMT